MFEFTKQGAIAVINGSAPLTHDNIYVVRPVFEQAMGKTLPRIVFNLQQVPLLDSAGLELILEYRDICAARGGGLLLAAPNALCRDILNVTGLTNEFGIYDDTITAVGSFSQ